MDYSIHFVLLLQKMGYELRVHEYVRSFLSYDVAEIDHTFFAKRSCAIPHGVYCGRRRSLVLYILLPSSFYFLVKDIDSRREDVRWWYSSSIVYDSPPGCYSYQEEVNNNNNTGQQDAYTYEFYRNNHPSSSHVFCVFGFSFEEACIRHA